jgi:hypothetical protein
MYTIKTILDEIKDVPASRLEELYQFVHSLTSNTIKTEASRKKILSFGGCFSDMSEEDYSDFVHQTTSTRKQLFDRHNDL